MFDLYKKVLQANLRISAHRDVRLLGSLCIAAAIAFLAYITRLTDVTHDLFHEMALAKVWIQTGVFPFNDVFAYTPTVAPTVHHEWATGLIGYWISAASPLGVYGLMVFKLILVMGIGLALYRAARNNGAHPIVFAVISPIVFPMLWVGFATIRAQMFTLAALAVTILMLQADWRGSRKWVLGWFAIYVAWLNLHAGFVVGIGLVEFHTFERIIDSIATAQASDSSKSLFATMKSWNTWNIVLRRICHLLILVPFLMVGALMNPWTWDYIPYLVRAISMPRPTIVEWQPLWYTHDAVTTLATFGVSVYLLLYVARNRDWRRLRGWLFCIIAAYMALKHIRHGSLYAIVWIAYMPGWLTHTPLGKWIIESVQKSRENAMLISKAVGATCGCYALAYPIWLPSFPDDVDAVTMSYPLGVVEYLERNQIQGNVMAPFHCGAYLSWKLYPNVKVSLDGRYEVAYQQGVYEDHIDFYAANPGWEAILDKYPHDYIIAPTTAPVAKWIHKRHPASEDSSGTDSAQNRDSAESPFSRWESIYRDESFEQLKRIHPRG